MILSEIRQILESQGLRLTKSLGQNFLHDGNQLRRIVQAADLKKGDRLLEIGPGLGPLTEQLLASGCPVLAIEKDRRLAAFLSQRHADARNLTVIHDDALEFLRRESRDWSGWKLVANLPYSVASPILVELAQAPHPPERMVVTVQLEVAQRILAEPGRADFGVLTLLIQLRYQPTAWFKIAAGCFYPTPEVDSACVTLDRRPAPRLTDEEARRFATVVKRAFSQRRKMMFKLLKTDWPADRLEAGFAAARIPSQARAEQLSLEQFVRLTEALSAPCSAPCSPKTSTPSADG